MNNVTINKVELRGRIGTVRVQSVNDTLVANFSLCTEKHYKDRSGNNVIECTWHHVVVWEGEEINLGGLSRGVLVHLTGEIRNSQYSDTQGNVSILAEIVAKSILIINENNSKLDFQGDQDNLSDI